MMRPERPVLREGWRVNFSRTFSPAADQRVSANIAAASAEPPGDLHCGVTGADHFVKMVHNPGEGRWTIAAAIDGSVPSPVLRVALYQRFNSRGEDDSADKVLSALGYQFGGHEEKPDAEKEAPI